MKVGIINYGMGNLGSVFRAIDTLGEKPVLIDQGLYAHTVDTLILPGVGNFSECKKNLDQSGWTEAILNAVLNHNKPLLGICLGMQLLADFGEEGAGKDSPSQGLGLISGRVISLKDIGGEKRIPHVGWNSVSISGDSSLLAGIPNGTDFYFVHSYAFVADRLCDTLATADYGVTITAAVAHENVWGVQFHPEKSSKAGLRVLKNFIESRRC